MTTRGSCITRVRAGSRIRGLAGYAVHLIALLTLLAPPAQAQRRQRAPAELHGSKASVEKMYSFAELHGLTFYLTPTNLDSAIANGRLVPLTGGATYELTRALPTSLQSALPTVEQIEAELAAAPEPTARRRRKDGGA